MRILKRVKSLKVLGEQMTSRGHCILRYFHSTNHARELREKYSEYFMNKGCVPWQWNSARVDF